MDRTDAERWAKDFWVCQLYKEGHFDKFSLIEELGRLKIDGLTIIEIIDIIDRGKIRD